MSGRAETDFDPYVDDFGHELECTVCCGAGDCDANADPLWDCDDNLHPCHACGGSGKRRDRIVRPTGNVGCAILGMNGGRGS